LTGAAAGTLGAYFSIAIGLRNRTVLIDLQKWDNRNDGLLRIAVGTIGAGILLCLLLAQWVTLSGVTETLTGKKGEDLALLMALSIGFVAGFSERAVGDLLGKAGDSLTDAAPSKDVAVEQAKAAAAAATQAPVTGPPDSDVTAAAPADPAGDVLDESPCDSPPVDGEPGPPTRTCRSRSAEFRRMSLRPPDPLRPTRIPEIRQIAGVERWSILSPGFPTCWWTRD
jgi:hypothetical protein